MSQINIRHKGPLCGELTPPSDKSISHRAVIISSLAKGESTIRNFLPAEDPLRTLEAFRKMGVKIEVRSRTDSQLDSPGTEIVISGKGLYGLKEPKDIIDCGNSGTTMRLLSGVLAGQSFSTVLTGDDSLQKRPMQRIITPLTEMGASIESEKDGYPPLTITGKRLNPITYKSPVASAQVKSSVLLAGLYCDGVTSVIEPGKSRDHTERMLKSCGADISVKGLKVSITGMKDLRPLSLSVPGDLSSAAFFIIAGLLVPRSEILIKHTGINPTRTGLIDILKMMGAYIRLENKKEISGEHAADIFVKHSTLIGTEIRGEMILKAIDEFPVICVAAARARGITKITGAGELRIKESDRIAAMSTELRKMGVDIEEYDDGLTIEGKDHFKPAVIQSYGDHRIAMAMAIAGLLSEGETIIDNTDCINTSFPGFMEMLESLQKQDE